MTNGNHVITEETRLPLKVTFAIVAFAITLTVAWLDIKHGQSDARKVAEEAMADAAATRVYVRQIAEKLGVVQSWPLSDD